MFTLDTVLSAVLESGKLKFKSFYTLKSIFPLKEFYREASSQQVADFCAHAAIKVDAAHFASKANEKIRRLVHAVLRTKVLDRYSGEEIAGVAQRVRVQVQLEDGKIVMPGDPKGISDLLRFLDDGIYAAPLSGNEYITNSKRPYRG